jgi:aryl-alcohol dehydrogenase
MRVTAAVMEEKSGVFRVDDIELDAARSDEVLGKITVHGICHTDLHARDGYFAMPYPAVYGHEGAGVVAAVGISGSARARRYSSIGRNGDDRVCLR